MTPEQAAKLREPFPKSVISSLPKGGTSLAYLNHAVITARLLEVDPSWTWEPVAYDERGLPAVDEKGGLWIRLTVCGVTRLGYGEPQGSDYFDRVKGSISNAIRVAAMRFGVGLDLWSKEEITTTFDHPRPVATEQQVVNWTAAISAAPDLIHLKGIADEISGYHIADELRQELRAMWHGRHQELNDGN